MIVAAGSLFSPSGTNPGTSAPDQFTQFSRNEWPFASTIEAPLVCAGNAVTSPRTDAVAATAPGRPGAETDAPAPVTPPIRSPAVTAVATASNARALPLGFIDAPSRDFFSGSRP